MARRTGNRPAGPGAARKAPGTAVDPRNGTRAILNTTGERFDPPEHVDHPMALASWEHFWNDPVSSLLTEVDRIALDRWIDLVNRYWTLMDRADAEPLQDQGTAGSVKEVLNPLYKVAMACHTAATGIEIRLGVTPKSRASLGIQIVEAHKQMDDFQAAARNALPVAEDDYDPRTED